MHRRALMLGEGRELGLRLFMQKIICIKQVIMLSRELAIIRTVKMA